MTRDDLMLSLKESNPDLFEFLSTLSESEWKDPDLCIVGDEADGTVSYFWPSKLDAT